MIEQTQAQRGNFIVLEGQGFTGKTEQSALLVARLVGNGINVWETQEPGGVPSALRIRHEILDKRGKGLIGPEEETVLFYKSRERFLRYGVRPALKKGRWVVSTRFTALTWIYQGKEGGVNPDLLAQLEQDVVRDTQPELYLLLDVPPEEIYNRLTAKHARVKHSFNEVDVDKISKRRQAYLELAQENRYGNWFIINGIGSISEVHEIIWAEVARKFGLQND